jgi:predicted permease
MKTIFTRPHLLLISIIGVIVPSRLRADWRDEWESELRHREALLADWDRLDWYHKWDLLKRSAGAFRDALWLQRQRREDEVVQDLRFGFRMLLKQPAFTLVCVFTLALGIGANAAIYSVVNALLFRPLDGVNQPGQLVQFGRQYTDKTTLSDSSYPDFLDYRTESTVMAGVAAISSTAFHISAAGGTERVEGEFVSSDYFNVLGVRAASGRLLGPADDRDNGADLVCVISDRLSRSLGGPANIAGSTVRLDGHPFTIVGVVDETFTGLRIGTPRDIWVPMTALRRLDPKTAARLDQRHASWLELFGRLKPGVTLEQARSELSVIAARLERAYPATNAHAGVRLEPGLGHDVDTEQELRRFARLPFAAVGIVLLIACANVAGLLLTRGSARRREIATRLALGAGRIRVVRQLLTESMTLAFAGGVSGLAVAVWLTAWLRSLLPDRFLFISFDVDLGLDWRVLAFTFAVAAATGLVFGLAPALQVSRPDLVVALKGSRAPGHRRIGLGTSLVVGEVALSLILLVAAGLCVRTLKNVEAIDVGYQPAQVLTARIDLARQGYTDDRGRAFQQQLLARIESSAGVEAAGFAVTLPLNDSRWENPVRRDGDPTRFQTFQNVVSPGYFKAMSIPVVMGRNFSSHDDDRAEPVAILNQTLARLMWPDESPLGKRLTFKGRAIEVVGVVRDIKGRSLVDSPGPMFYIPLSQDYHPAMVLQLRTALPPEQFVATLRREVNALDNDLPVYAIKPLAEHVTATLTPQRLLAHLTTAFGLLALLLAAIGLYGLLSYSVTERTAEIGVRMAIGARKVDVVRLFMARGMILALWGVAIGLGAAALLMPLIKSALFGVSALDPIALTMAPAALILVALMACFMPARRAANADPKIALRYE